MPEEVALLVNEGGTSFFALTISCSTGTLHCAHFFSSKLRLFEYEIIAHAIFDFFSSIGFAVLVDDPEAHHDPTISQLASWDLDRTQDVEKQLKVLQAQLESSNPVKEDKSMSEAAIQKRKAREEKRRKAAEAAQKAAAEAAGDALFVPEASPASEVPQDTLVNASSGAGAGSSSASASVPYTVSVPTTSDGFSWYAPEKHTYSTLKEAQDAGIWTYPSTEEEKAKCGVFSDLWHKGYYMGGGSKFGGEWLVYPGNASRQ